MTSYVIVYLDDVLIMVNSIDQASERLCIVLNIFTKVEFSFKYSKCPFVETSVLYLEYVIHNGKVSLNSGKRQTELHPIHKISMLYRTVRVVVTSKLSGKSESKEEVIVLG